MTKQEFLAASLPNNQEIQWRDIGERVLVEPRTIHYLFTNLEMVKPIIRPLSDLIKECVQADYNDGKPFIPIVELAKMCNVNLKFSTEFKVDTEHFTYGCKSGDSLFWYNTKGAFQYSIVTDVKEHIFAIHNQLQLFQQLLKWHFDLITEDCEKVLVTETFNPYK